MWFHLKKGSDNMKNQKKGGIAAMISVLFGIVMLTVIFFNYIFMNLDMQRFGLIDQYTRDSLLVLETNTQVERDFLMGVKSDLADKLVKNTSEYIKVYVTVNGTKYDADSMSATITPNFGSEIILSIQYHYIPQSITLTNGFAAVKGDRTLKVMGTNLRTVSLNRGS